jgi:hypothetical protein
MQRFRGRWRLTGMKKLLAPLLALLMVAFVAPATAVTARERASIPWDQVGEGWVLASIQRGPYKNGDLQVRARSLELISPEGTRYSLYATTKLPDKNYVDPSNFSLIDWDPVARTALLRRWVSIGRSQAIRLDLESGSSQTLALPKQEMRSGLRPDGAGVLSQTFGGKVLSITWDGVRSDVGQADQGGAITTPDGLAVLVADPGHLTVMPLDGSAAHTIATPGECNPRRWYGDTRLLASCLSRKGTQLVTIGLDGTVTPMAGLRRTTSRDFHGPSWDDTDVRILGGRSYYEGNGPCGGSFIARENADGEEKMVRVPGSIGGVSLVDARDDRLVIAHTATCDSGPPRAVLALFDPVSKDEDVLVTLEPRERWAHVLAWDEPRPWGY